MVLKYGPLTLYGTATQLVAPCLALLESSYHSLFGKFGWKESLKLINQRLCLPNGSNLTLKSPVSLWFHGASLGETRTAVALCAAILRRFDSENGVLHAYRNRTNFGSCLFTSANVAAQEPLERSLELLCRTSAGLEGPSDFHGRLLPYDCPNCVKRFLFRFFPRNAVFIESELWPVLLRESKNNGVKLFLLDGRISPASKQRWTCTKFGRSLLKTTLNSFDFIGARNEEEAFFFKQFGCSNVKVIPPLKTLLPLGPERASLSCLTGLGPSWMGISTHEPEEFSLLRIHKRLSSTWRAGRKPLLILAPRHILRTRTIFDAAQALGFKSSEIALYSQYSYTENIRLLIIDSYGVLSSFFQLCKIVFVGNSLFPPGGGHNIAEALHYKCVVLHGNYIKNFTDAFRYLNSLHFPNAVTCTVQDEENLFERVKYFLLHPDKVCELGEVGYKCVKEAERLVVSSVLHELMCRPSVSRSA